MITIVFLTFLVYAAILVSLILLGDRRRLTIELSMFLLVLMATVVFLAVYWYTYLT